MVRFFVEKSQLKTDFMVLTGDNAEHAKVLRIKNGEQVMVCDGDGTECICTVSDVSPGCVSVVVNSCVASESESLIHVGVYVSFPKSDKLEHIIQKATELGADEIVAYPSSRCVSKPDDKSLKKKLERWKKIAISAAEQSGRGRIPEVILLPDFRSAVNRATQADLPILFYENERATTLHMALEEADYKSISLMTGPEGGYDDKEVQMAAESGMHICTLGKRILRCETAPLCALSAVMYAAGEF